MAATSKTLGVLLFPQFELLDVCGPLEMFGYVPDLTIHLVAEAEGPVPSTQGPALLAECSLEQAPALDMLLIPGGLGTRSGIENEKLMEWIVRRSTTAEWVLSVCTGSALLARAGVLDGRRATSNKLAFEWVRAQSAQVDWVDEARWVWDGKYVTSSGVAAGIDMSLAVIERLVDAEWAQWLARQVEYEWQTDPDRDPFHRAAKDPATK